MPPRLQVHLAKRYSEESDELGIWANSIHAHLPSLPWTKQPHSLITRARRS
jgi:hypothetical protein